MILSVIQHAGALSARPRQYRQRATLMYDAITELIKASSRNTDPVVGLGGLVVVRRRCGGLRCVKPPPAALTALSLPNQHLVDWRRGAASDFGNGPKKERGALSTRFGFGKRTVHYYYLNI